MKKITSILLICGVLYSPVAWAEEAEEEIQVEITEESAVEEAPREDLFSEDEEMASLELVTSSSSFDPLLDYSVDPMAANKALGVYETDLATGAATYNYPIYLPPGRNGVQPEVSLFYNNQASSADSIVGYGWDLWVGGSISRTQEYGVFDMYDTNEFYLNMNGASGKLLAVSLDDDEHGEYGLEVEEAFYQYEFEADDSWVVTDQNGTKYYFGQDADSRQGEIFEWYLDEIVDVSGNCVSFEYSEDQGRVYPQAIYYGDFEVQFELTARDDWTKWYDKGFEVKTEYLVTGIDVYYDGSAVREYDLSYTVGENGLRSMLESITETGNSVVLPATEFDYSNTGLSYDFVTLAVASEDLGNSALIDINGDGYADQGPFEGSTSSPYYVYSTLNNGGGSAFGESYSELYYTQGTSGASILAGDYLVDMNGDSLPELLYLYDEPGDSYNCLYYNYGEGFVGDYDICGAFVRPREADGFRFGDFDADGLLDLFTGDEEGVDWEAAGGTIYLNDGDYGFSDSGYDSPVAFAWGDDSYPYYISSQDTGVRLVDLNGDGLTDIVQRYQDRNYDFYETDSETAVMKYFLNTGDGSFVEDSDYDLEASSSWISTYMEYTDYHQPEGSYYSYGQDVCFRDFNGDGVVDIIDDNVVYLWDGVDTWNVATITTPDVDAYCGGMEYNGVDYFSYGGNDLDGDGLMDFFWSREGEVESKEVYLSDWDKPDLLESVTTSGGAEIEISYESAMPFAIYVVSEVTVDDGLGNESNVSYEFSGGAYYKYFDGVKGEFSKFEEVVVSEDGAVTIYYFDTGCHEGELCSSGIEDEMVVYSDGWHVIDGGYLRDLTICPVVAGLASDYAFEGTYITYDSDFADYFEEGEDWDDAGDDFMYGVDYSGHALKGKLLMVEVYDDSGVLYTRTVNDWSADELGDDRYFPHLDDVLTFVFEGESTARESSVSYEYNSDYGIVMSETDWGEVEADEESYEITDYLEGDEVYLTNSYAFNETDFVLKIAEVVLADGDGGVLSEMEYYYDDYADLGDIGDGFLTEEMAWLDTDSSWISTGYEYDEYGNVIAIVNPRGYETVIVYDDEGFYPVEITNALSQTQYFEVNYVNGQPAEVTDLNGYEYVYDYDGLGRILSVSGPSVDGTGTEVYVEYEYDDSSVPRCTHEVLTDGTADGFNTYTYFDGLDREVQVKVEGEDSYIVADVLYTERGEVEFESLNYFESETSYAGIDYVYDALGRVIEVTTDLGTTTTSYSVFEEEVTDAMGNITTYYRDVRGNLVQVDDALGSSTYYEWDLLGRLSEVTDALSNVRGFEWDSLGRLVLQEEMHAASDGDYAIWEYEYDENGNLTEMTVPAGYTMAYSYDELDRIESEEGVSYEYDTNGVGFLASASDEAGSVEYEYDALGSVISEVRVIEGESYETGFVNDLMGRVTDMVYPSGSEVSYEFNEGSLVESVSFDGADVVSDIDYSEMGQFEEVYYANGDIVENTYDPSQMYLLTDRDGTSYEYDATGNVLWILDDADTYFEYDDLHRLTRAVRGEGLYDTGLFTDEDADGITAYDGDNCVEFYNPDQVDTDGDGIGDECEDTDGDGLRDVEEDDLGSDSGLSDTDGDGFSDYEEYEAGTDLNDASSMPGVPITFTGNVYASIKHDGESLGTYYYPSEGEIDVILGDDYYINSVYPFRIYLSFDSGKYELGDVYYGESETGPWHALADSYISQSGDDVEIYTFVLTTSYSNYTKLSFEHGDVVEEEVAVEEEEVVEAAVDYDRTYEYDEIGNMIYKSDIGDLLYEEGGNANVYAVTSAGSYVFEYDEAGNVIEDGVLRGRGFLRG